MRDDEINLKEFEFEAELLENVRLFDEVLSELDEPLLLENQNFAARSGFEFFSRYLVMENAHRKPNQLPLVIWFEGKDLVIDVAGIREAFEWSKEQITKDRKSVIDFISNLFTGYVLIEEKGSGQIVQIFDSNGEFAYTSSRNNLFHMITGRFVSSPKNIRKLYLPLFFKK